MKIYTKKGSKWLLINLVLVFIIIFPVKFDLFSRETPLQSVRGSNRKILDVFIYNKSIDKKAETEILEIIKSYIHIPVISKRIINKFCKQYTGPLCKNFDRVFQKYLYTSILKKLRKHHAVYFKYSDMQVKKGKAVIKAVGIYKSETADIEYHMEKYNDQWYVVNMIVDDIDMINNYRKQFEKLLSEDSIENIISHLEKKITRYEDKFGKVNISFPNN